MDEDVEPKWIVEDGCLIIGRVTYHHELSCTNDQTKVKGGGYWHIDKENKILHLYGESTTYSYCKSEDIMECVRAGKVGTWANEEQFRDYYIYATRASSLEVHMMEYNRHLEKTA